ncbi:MAG TPA: septal ring lytic transglycosylase RlpA family protein [Solirubrobacteraceae bacterium]|nr:septal ring lytic transglycosylase RlpA family protein [Solirubrobacteraceae bacterium]
MRRRAFHAGCLAGLCGLAALPAAAAARSPRGGQGATSGTGGGGLSTTLSPRPDHPTVRTLGGVVDASGDGISFTVAAAGTLGRPLTVAGTTPAGDTGATVAIEAAAAQRTKWRPVATATITAGGAFSAQWTPATDGSVRLRAVLLPGVGGASTVSASGSVGIGGSASAAAGELTTDALTIPIFRDAVATLYGPGFWGHHTACGERLTQATLGVASRTLRCGTRVTILYQGRALTVPVIDRGPFAPGVTWDLTMATGRALGITATSTIGALTARLPTALAARS